MIPGAPRRWKKPLGESPLPGSKERSSKKFNKEKMTLMVKDFVSLLG